MDDQSVKTPVANVPASAQTDQPVKPPVKLPTDPSVLIAQVQAVFQNIDPGALDTLVRAWVAAGEGAGDPTQRDTVVKRLTVLMRVTLRDIQQAAAAVLEGLNQEMIDLKARFEKETGGGTAGSGFEAFADRYKAKQEELDKLALLAGSVLKMVMNICASLNIPNPDAPKDTKPTKGSKASELVLSLRQKMVEAGVLAVAQGAPTVPPSWTTPPVLTEDDPNYQTILAIHEVVKASTSADEALAQLNVYGIGLDKISQALVAIVKKARAQLTQCDEVRKNVSKDYTGYAHEVEAVQRMLTVLAQVNSYYGIGSTAKASVRRY